MDDKGFVLIDLHTHSSKSDGILRPQAVVSRAYDKGVRILALTDHDTTSGWTEAAEEAQRIGIRLISGIEFSSQWSGRGIHIVGLNFDPEHPVMVEAVKRQQNARLERTEMIVRHLEKRGIRGSYDGARGYAGEGSVCRPHFARYLVECGAVPSVKAAFQHYLRDAKLGAVNGMWATIEEVVSWTEQAGGVAVLAHPEKYKLTRAKLRRLLGDFRDAGGRALEVASGRQDPASVSELIALAGELSLQASVGSDFHDPEHGWQDIGCVAPLNSEVDCVWSEWV